MATALRSPRAGSGAPETRLAQLFRREIVPQIASLDAERAKRRTQFLATLFGCALGVPGLTALLWPLDPGWAVAVGVIGLAIGVNVL
ncbi:MAG TPA: hypothetical protein VLE23_18050, partial [Geminicoccaceae bacterium]|nr:hypothetical protein [Geminicoccaceae bacterium]